MDDAHTTEGDQSDTDLSPSKSAKHNELSSPSSLVNTLSLATNPVGRSRVQKQLCLDLISASYEE